MPFLDIERIGGCSGGVPPGNTIGGGRPDRCAGCPVRLAFGEYLDHQTGRPDPDAATVEMANVLALAFGFVIPPHMGEEAMEEVFEATLSGNCAGPEIGPRYQLDLTRFGLGVIKFGALVSRCTNQEVPANIRLRQTDPAPGP